MPETTLFQSGSIGAVTLKNRLVKAATFETLADADGLPTEAMLGFYEGLAKGGVGLIITGSVAVGADGRLAPLQSSLQRDEAVAGFRALTEVVHRHGAKIFAQLNHAGRQSFPKIVGGDLVSASNIADLIVGERPRPLSESELVVVEDQFAAAAARAKAAGFDGIELHAGHGYLINQFLCPHTNRRSDRYGGSLERRMCFLLELVARCRAAVEPGFPIAVKLNADDRLDFPKRGTRLSEAVEMAARLEAAGVDALEVTCGTQEAGHAAVRGKMPIEMFTRGLGQSVRPGIRWLIKAAAPLMSLRFRYFEGYNLPYAAEIKKRVRIPVISVGGMQSPRFMAQAIQAGHADFVSMARALIADPELPNKLHADLPYAECSRCNRCLAMLGVEGVACHDSEVIARRVST